MCDHTSIEYISLWHGIFYRSEHHSICIWYWEWRNNKIWCIICGSAGFSMRKSILTVFIETCLVKSRFFCIRERYERSSICHIYWAHINHAGTWTQYHSWSGIIIFYDKYSSCDRGRYRTRKEDAIPRYIVSQICISSIFDEFYLLTQDIRSGNLMSWHDGSIYRRVQESEYGRHSHCKYRHTDDKFDESKSFLRDGMIMEWHKGLIKIWTKKDIACPIWLMGRSWISYSYDNSRERELISEWSCRKCSCSKRRTDMVYKICSRWFDGSTKIKYTYIIIKIIFFIDNALSRITCRCRKGDIRCLSLIHI